MFRRRFGGLCLLVVQPLLICAEPRSTGRQLLEVLNEGWQGREVNLVLYCITRRRTDQITQRGRGLKTELYRFPRRLGTWAIPCVEGSSPLGARPQNGNAKAEAMQYSARTTNRGVKGRKGQLWRTSIKPGSGRCLGLGFVIDRPRLLGCWALEAGLWVCGVR